MSLGACSLPYPAYNAQAPYCLQPLSQTHFSALSHKRHDFRENVIERKMCFDFLYSFYLKHFSFLEEFSEIVVNMKTSLCKVPVIFVGL